MCGINQISKYSHEFFKKCCVKGTNSSYNGLESKLDKGLKKSVYLYL